MQLLKRLFGKEKKQLSQSNAPAKKRAEKNQSARPVTSSKEVPNLSVDTLKQLIPLRNLTDEELAAFTATQKPEIFRKGLIIYEKGEHIDSIIYLLEGTVEIKPSENSGYEVSDNIFKAKYPLSTGKRHNTTAIAKTDVKILRVSTLLLDKGNSAYSEKKGICDLNQLEVPIALSDCAIFHTFCKDYGTSGYILPTLPDVAIKLRTAMQKDIGVAEAAKIIQLDPALSAKLIQVANSPLFLSASPATNCLEAVNRIGLTATRNLTISISMKQAFKYKDKEIQKRMQKYWKSSIHLSSVCCVLAAKTGCINPDEALLAGLICDIGIVPFLKYTDGFLADFGDTYNANDMELSLAVLRGPLGVSLLQDWGFSDEFTKLPAISEDWFYDKGEELTLSDVVILAKLHSYIGSPKMNKLPNINSIPAYGKLKDGTLSPEHSLNLLHTSKDQIKEMVKVLS